MVFCLSKDLRILVTEVADIISDKFMGNLC